MKYVRRILSALELLAGYLFLLFISYALTRSRGTGILDMPSYYREVSRSPLLILGGSAVLLALFASLFSWVRTQIDLRAEATRRQMIRTDVTEKAPVSEDTYAYDSMGRRPGRPRMPGIPGRPEMRGQETDFLVGGAVPQYNPRQEAYGRPSYDDATEFVPLSGGPGYGNAADFASADRRPVYGNAAAPAYPNGRPAYDDATEFVPVSERPEGGDLAAFSPVDSRPNRAGAPVYTPPGRSRAATQAMSAPVEGRPENGPKVFKPQSRVYTPGKKAEGAQAFRPAAPQVVKPQSAAPQVVKPQSAAPKVVKPQPAASQPAKPLPKVYKNNSPAPAEKAGRIWLREEEDDEE
ncbi:MAG: hypothetical protein K6E83_09915 [Clostridium sp.]|nr:hypothetical protein [Clostridium sp.]